MDIALRIAVLFPIQALSMFLTACFLGWLIRTIKGEQGKFPFGTCMAAAILLAILTTAIDLNKDRARESAYPPSEAAAAAKVYAASESVLTPTDLAALEAFSGCTRKNNNVAARLVRVLTDETLDRQGWLTRVEEPLRELRATCEGMDECVSSFSDAGLKATVQELTASFQRQLKCWEAVQAAVSVGDEEARKLAIEELLDAADERQKVAAKYMARLREVLPPDVLRKQLDERRTELAP